MKDTPNVHVFTIPPWNLKSSIRMQSTKNWEAVAEVDHTEDTESIR